MDETSSSCKDYVSRLSRCLPELQLHEQRRRALADIDEHQHFVKHRDERSYDDSKKRNFSGVARAEDVLLSLLIIMSRSHISSSPSKFAVLVLYYT
jgi:hypothetical protein